MPPINQLCANNPQCFPRLSWALFNFCFRYYFQRRYSCLSSAYLVSSYLKIIICFGHWLAILPSNSKSI